MQRKVNVVEDLMKTRLCLFMTLSSKESVRINIVMFVLGSIYRPEVTFSYEIPLLPPLYGFLGTIPSWILYSKKELSTRQIMVRKILQVMVLELILILVIFGGENLCKENIPVITALAISVFLVYVLDVRTAKTVMKELSEYQNAVLK